MTDSFGQEGGSARDVAGPSRRVLVITRRGPPERPFGWEIRDDGGEIARSPETFTARTDAVVDGQQELDELQAASVNC